MKGFLEDLDRFFTNNEFTEHTRVGILFIKYFMQNEINKTKTAKKMSWNEFLEQYDKIIKNDGFAKRFYEKYYKTRTLDYIKTSIFKLKYGYISVFPPAKKYMELKNIYKKYPFKKVIDPCSGWGSRMLICSKLPCEWYIGFDSNNNLYEPYYKIREHIKEYSNIKIENMIANSLDVDFSNYKYDCVFTSPPYYNIETYNEQPVQFRTKKEWNEQFYKPLFSNLWKNLQVNGIMIINIPEKIYDNAFKPWIQYDDIFDFNLISRHKTRNEKSYKEHYYIFQKIS